MPAVTGSSPPPLDELLYGSGVELRSTPAEAFGGRVSLFENLVGDRVAVFIGLV